MPCWCPLGDAACGGVRVGGGGGGVRGVRCELGRDARGVTDNLGGGFGGRPAGWGEGVWGGR